MCVEVLTIVCLNDPCLRDVFVLLTRRVYVFVRDKIVILIRRVYQIRDAFETGGLAFRMG